MLHLPDIRCKHRDDDGPVEACLFLGALAALETHFDLASAVDAFPQLDDDGEVVRPMAFRHLCYLAWAARGSPGSTPETPSAGFAEWSAGLESVELIGHQPDDPTGPAAAGG